MVSGILLAAGNSKRMGEDNKLLLPLNGETLFVHMLNAMQDSKLDELIVVLGHDFKRMIPHCNSNTLKLAINGNHLEGQTTSIKAGMQLVNPSSDAVMICLCDMPLITSQHLDRLLSSFRDGRMLRPMNGETPGNPSLFPKHLFEEIMNCPDKNGCKSVIAQNKDLLEAFQTDDPAFFQDIDTPSEYAKFVK